MWPLSRPLRPTTYRRENVQNIGTPKERRAQEEENTKDNEAIGHM